MTEEFIQQFKDADPTLRDSKEDTPFHVAAKAKNPKAIIYMLNSFAHRNKRLVVDNVDGQDTGQNNTNNHKCWDVDKVDKGQKPQNQNTLIKICARRGNAKAVALLIKHGADVSQGVLHEIVLESVRNPHKIDDLVRVYQSIVDNAVTWWCMKHGDGIPKLESCKDYTKTFWKAIVIDFVRKIRHVKHRPIPLVSIIFVAHSV